MTSQTKHYIEMIDMLALRCDCKHCSASLSLPMVQDVAKCLLTCPNCGKQWARLENTTYELTINDFAKKVGELKLLLPSAGFRLYLEVACPASAGKD